MTGALRHLPRKGGADIADAPDFFRDSRKRMDCGEVADAGYRTGSGTVESGNRTPVTQRLTRSARRLGRDGARGVDVPSTARVRSPPPGMVHAFRKLAAMEAARIRQPDPDGTRRMIRCYTFSLRKRGIWIVVRESGLRNTPVSTEKGRPLPVRDVPTPG